MLYSKTAPIQLLLPQLEKRLADAQRLKAELESRLVVLRGARPPKTPPADWRKRALTASLDANLAFLKNVFDRCTDVVFHRFVFAQDEAIALAVVYVDGLIDKKLIADNIVNALALDVPMAVPGLKVPPADVLKFIRERGLSTHQIHDAASFREVVEGILEGNAVLLADGQAAALIIDVKGWLSRMVEEPSVEPSVRGPREAFIETLRTNTSLIRRIIATPDLKIEMLSIGRRTRTKIALVYIEGVAASGLIAEIKQRLSRIDVDSIEFSAQIEEFIEDDPWSPFPQINHTERPDVLCSRLLEGRAALVVDGTPFCLTMPSLFIEYFQAPDDYAGRWLLATLIRLLRIGAMFLSMVLPSLYVAITTFHPEMLPTALLLNFAAQREVVPFPTFLEVLLMDIVFEFLREAGIRLPRAVGQAVSIVGGLVLGETAVRAGLVGEATAIVVEFTGIASIAFI